MTEYKTTYDWLKDSLTTKDKGYIIKRQNRNWISIAGFSRCGCIFAIYKDETEYCVHAGDEWEEIKPPLFGYFSLELSWDELLHKIAERYDTIRKEFQIKNKF
jgi:hypothetical protein